MKYTIHNITYSPHDLDDDIIHFEYEVHFTEPEKLQVKYHLALGDLIRSIQNTHPDFYSYYQKTKSSLDKWGPAETQTLEAMGDEAVGQIYQFLEEYLLSCEWVPKLFEREKQLQSMRTDEQINQQQQAEKVVKKLSGLASPGMKRVTNRDRLFCETASKKMRETALDIYPEIADLEAEELKEFKYLFTREIMSMSERITKLIYGKKTSK